MRIEIELPIEEACRLETIAVGLGYDLPSFAGRVLCDWLQGEWTQADYGLSVAVRLLHLGILQLRPAPVPFPVAAAEVLRRVPESLASPAEAR